MFDFALRSAKILDEYLKERGKPIGPLHGLPVSIKDNFNLIDVDSTIGFTSRVGKPAIYSAILVDILTLSGAILYVKTNVPTAMMMLETVNNVIGRTLNPINRNLTSGGSSGGESALIAFAGSPLGVGTDIAGSLRVPAACTGVFTLKPSFGRFPTLRAASGLAGQEAVPSVSGPMARSLQDCVLFAEVVAAAESWKLDPKSLPIPWRVVERKKKLKLGVMWNDGIVAPTPPVKRALEETVKKLEVAGHEIVEWQPQGHVEGLEILRRMFSADGGKSLRRALEPTYEPFRPEMQIFATASELGTYDMWQVHLERTELCQQYLHRWIASGIDGLLCPTTPYASVQNGNFKHFGYTGIFNILDYSSISFPCGVTANKDLDKVPKEYAPLGDVDAEVQGAYSEEAVHGMPVSLQIVAGRLEDEKVVAIAQTILNTL